jgi:hypothetical protein
MNCPECGSNQTRRLEVIYDQGSSDSVGSAVIFGERNLDFAVTESASQTKLAQKCAPPSKKGYFLAICLIAVSLIFTMVTVFGYIFAVVFLIVCFVDWQYNTKQWPPLYRAWLKTWYCFKCGKVYRLNQ